MQREASPVRPAMLRRLVKRGFEVAAFDADPARTRPPAVAGAAEASSAAEVGRRSDSVGVGFEPEADACLTGEDGAVESMDAGDCVAVCPPLRSTARRIRRESAPTGASAFSMRRWAADEGALLALVGAAADVSERLRPRPSAPSIWAISATGQSPRR